MLDLERIATNLIIKQQNFISHIEPTASPLPIRGEIFKAPPVRTNAFLEAIGPVFVCKYALPVYLLFSVSEMGNYCKVGEGFIQII